MGGRGGWEPQARRPVTMTDPVLLFLLSSSFRPLLISSTQQTTSIPATDRRVHQVSPWWTLSPRFQSGTSTLGSVLDTIDLDQPSQPSEQQYYPSVPARPSYIRGQSSTNLASCMLWHELHTLCGSVQRMSRWVSSNGMQEPKKTHPECVQKHSTIGRRAMAYTKASGVTYSQ